MMRKIVAAALALFTFSGFLIAEEGPLLPDGKNKVHDMNRVKPRVVETTGAVEVKPPGDARILFGGDNLDAWTGGDWKVENGVMIADGNDLQTKEEFGDIQMHVEWRIPEGRKVSGQAGGNSGIFLMGLYECQILQSNGNDTYADGQAGAIYGQTPPLVNATAPQGHWQSYDLVFMAPRYENGEVVKPATITLFHNGVLLHNAKEYLGPTLHKEVAAYPKSHPETGPIRLQFHGDPVEYRNIWVRKVGGYDAPESGILPAATAP